MASQSPRANETQFAPSEPLAERLTHMLVAMATELATTRERVDTLERMLCDAGVLEPGGADTFTPDASAEESRRQRREQFLDRVFEHLQAEITAAKHSTAKGESE
jgi:hypothetical protein